MASLQNVSSNREFQTAPLFSNTFLDHNFTLDIFTKINNFHDCLQFDIHHRKRLTTHFEKYAA